VKIGVCAKVAADPNARIKVAPSGDGIVTDGVKMKLADYDEYAVEEGIRTQAACGGEVVVITIGDASAEKLMRGGALALGVDKGVLILEEPADSLATAKLLAAAAKKEGCEVLFTGKSSTDEQGFQVGIMIAEILGWAHVSQVTELAFEGSSFTATRAMDGGVRQKVKGSLPAVITCEDGLNTVRYAKLPDIMKAKKKPLDTVTAGDLGVDLGAARTKVSNMGAPPPRPAGRIIAGDAATAAKELVRLLRDEAKVL
jgi:electron transfer flavoprotein beta subunit